MELKRLCRVVSGREDDSFVGVRATTEGVEVCFPVGYRLPGEAHIRIAVVQLLQVLAAAVKWAKQQGRLEEISTGTLTSESPMWAYLFLLRHYAETGRYYTDAQPAYAVNLSGKTDWRRTIRSHNSAHTTTKGKPFYAKLVTRRLETRQESEITRIHRFCVRKCYDVLGWLYGMARPAKESLPLPLSAAIALVRQTLDRVHRDAEKDLLRAMLAVLDEAKATPVEVALTYGTRKFDVAWEMLVRSVFGNEDERKFFPKSLWFFDEKVPPVQASSLRPDTILHEGEDYFVLDAKYYHSAEADKKNMPTTADVNKQLTYAEFVRERMGEVRAYNAFLLPTDSADFSLRCEGWNVPDWKHGELSSLSAADLRCYYLVLAIRVDTTWLMQTFARHPQGTLSLRRELAQMIRDNYLRALAACHAGVSNKG